MRSLLAGRAFPLVRMSIGFLGGLRSLDVEELDLVGGAADAGAGLTVAGLPVLGLEAAGDEHLGPLAEVVLKVRLVPGLNLEKQRIVFVLATGAVVDSELENAEILAARGAVLDICGKVPG
jgi:hypothetical protein